MSMHVSIHMSIHMSIHAHWRRLLGCGCQAVASVPGQHGYTAEHDFALNATLWPTLLVFNSAVVVLHYFDLLGAAIAARPVDRIFEQTCKK